MTEPQASQVPVQEGDLIGGKYVVERVLGIGGMGVVVAAYHTELDQHVAVKVLLPGPAQNPAVRERFSREARAAAKIKSEHVVRVADVGATDDGLPFIVMEYLEGRDLAQELAAGSTLTPGTAVDYILQACEALAEAHVAGFVHRDLKPGNLFLARLPDGSETIKVLDFGISKANITDAAPGSDQPGALTRDTDVFGSPLYMSPEQLKAVRDVDPRADVWALGVILYELLVGVTPFDRPTVAETFGAILYEKPKSVRDAVPSVSPALDRAILRCLEKDPSARFQNVGALAKALFPFAALAHKTSIDRTSRVLTRAGIHVESIPPPPPTLHIDNPASQAATRTAWDAASLPLDRRPRRSMSRVAIILGLGIGLVASGAFLATRFARKAPVPAAAPDPPRTADVPSVKPGAALPPSAATAAPSAAPSASAAASASATPPKVAAGPAIPAPHGKPAKTAATIAPATAIPSRPPEPDLTPVTPPAPPPPPPTPPEDPNGFGDRK